MNDASRSSTATTLIIVLTAIVALIAGIAAAYLVLRPAGEPELAKATYLPGGKPVQPFELVDHHGEPFTNARLQGRWTLMFFGFTHCPDACPTALAVLNAAEEGLKEKAPALPLQVVMVSVDPARDTPERLASYVPHFNPGFVGATGSDEELTALTRDLGILYRIHEPKPGEAGYMVDHSTAILLINPQGNLQAVFGPPHAPQPIVDDVLQIHGQYES